MPISLYLPATYQAGFATIANAIWGYLTTNPGSTLAQIATGISTPELQVNRALTTLLNQNLLVQRTDEAGVLQFWLASQFESLIVNNIAAARAWITTHDGGDIADLATDLTIPYGIAMALAEVLHQEGSCKILY